MSIPAHNYVASVVALVAAGRMDIVEVRRRPTARAAYYAGRRMARAALHCPAEDGSARALAIFAVDRLDPAASRLLLQRRVARVATDHVRRAP
jgi:hypothetical protein